jgi:signal transduction histidine kinase/CheY-like chemotaxis protein
VLSGMGVLIGMSALLLGWLAFNAIQQRRIAWNDADIESDRSAYLQIAVGERTRELVLVNEKLREEAATRIAAEAQLRQIQKMEAVGQLTGGIAHDFNNMLAVVVGSLDLARRRLNRDEEEARRHIENAMDGANRAASLTRRLLSFARHEPLLPEGVAPGKLIRGMSDLLDRTLGERITVTTRGFDADWQVWVDPHQLENAILNLAVNARDAMDGEGALTIESDQLRLGDGEVGSLAAGEYIRIAVTDTGCGMDQAVLERVFEPFFTTKPVGKGTGLGLSQVFGLARQSSGEVTVRSAPEEGATVSIYLPRHIAKSPRQANAVELVAVENAPLTAALNILVVEDDQRVRAATVAALEELGHTPVPCTAGADALEILETRTDIGLIITDVVMPGMTGPELISQVSTLYPHLAVLFVTGYAGEAGDAESFTGHEVLRKPFTINTLALSIAAARNRQINVPPLLATGGAAA